MSKVSITRCSGYDIDLVRHAVRQSVASLGGMQAFVQPGEKVLLKPNLLMRRKPEKATTTHPAVVQAVAELVIEAGGSPVICDSPGGYYTHAQHTLEAVYATCGMEEAARNAGAELCYDANPVDAPFPSGMTIKSIKTLQSVLDADKIINIPKLKTHMMMTFSGAVKNLFGIVPGSHKTEYHFRFEDEDDFAGVIVDICRFASPALTVMDAVVGMEGYGPTNGSPREIGLIFASADPYGLDVIASSAIGLEPRKVPTIKESVKRGLCSGKTDEMEIIGENLPDVAIQDFVKPVNKVAFNIWDWMMPRPVAKWLNRALKFKPGFRLKDCRGCGICAKSCPAAAIDMENGKPSLTVSRCISCFCCHELCNFDAVDIRKPWVFRVLFK